MHTRFTGEKLLTWKKMELGDKNLKNFSQNEEGEIRGEMTMGWIEENIFGTLNPCQDLPMTGQAALSTRSEMSCLHRQEASDNALRGGNISSQGVTQGKVVWSHNPCFQHRSAAAAAALLPTEEQERIQMP